MENSGSFSLDSNLPHSFFSSFSSNLSTTSTWKPILNSLQENRRINRLIQVRETRLQELSTYNHIPGHSRLSSEPFLEELPSTEQDRLTEILLLSQKNLKILSFKVGNLPQNLIRAMELVLDDPNSMTTSQKFDCFSAIELLQEKLCDLVLNSEEILSFFKDIALECEASASNPKSCQEGLLAFAEKREEIFISKDLNRVKIQNLHRLIMNLENWKRRKGIFVEELDSNSRIQYDECIRETIEKLGKKEQEVIDIRNYYKGMFDEVIEKVNGLRSGLKRLKHCVEFELFSTWSCLIGQENSNEPSCHQIIRKLANFQQENKTKNLKVINKFQVLKNDFNTKEAKWTEIFTDFNESILSNSQGIMSKIKQQEEFLSLMKGQLKQEQIGNEKIRIDLRESLEENEKILKRLKENQDLLDGLNKIRIEENQKKRICIGGVKINLKALDRERIALREMIAANKDFLDEGLAKFGKVFNVLCPWEKLGKSHNKFRNDVKIIIDAETCKIGSSIKSDIFEMLNLIMRLMKKCKIQMQKEKSEIQTLFQSYKESLDICSNKFLTTCNNFSNCIHSLQKSKSEMELQILNLQNQLSQLNSENVSLVQNIETTKESLGNQIQSLELSQSSLSQARDHLQSEHQCLTLQYEELSLKYRKAVQELSEKEFEILIFNEKISKDSEILKSLEKENKIIKEDLDEVRKSNQAHISKMSTLNNQLSSQELLISDLTNKSQELDLSLKQTAEDLKSKSMQASLLESILVSLKTSNQALTEECLKKDSKIKKLESITTSLKSIWKFNKDTLENLADLKKNHLLDFKSLQNYLEKSIATQQNQSFAIESLEKKKNLLKSKNLDLETEVSRLREANSKYIQDLSLLKGKVSDKLLKVKRKIKIFSMVLAHERTLIKDLHQDWMQYMRNSLESLKFKAKSFEDLRTAEAKKVKIMLEQVYKDAGEKVKKLEIELRKTENLVKEKEKEVGRKEEFIESLQNKLTCYEEKDLILDKMQFEIDKLNQQSSKKIENLEEEKLSICSSYELKISSLQESLTNLESLNKSQQTDLEILLASRKSNKKLIQDQNLLFKEKLDRTLKTLTNFRELNNILRSQVIKFLSSSSFDFEAIRIKLYEHVRLDIVKIKSNLENLKGKYSEERSLLHVKIDAMKNSIDSNQDLVIPVKDFIKENQESIDSLNDTFAKTSQTYQKNLEENIKKVDDLQNKIESYRIKGYELLNKYKIDQVIYEPEDYDSDLHESLDSLDNLSSPNQFSKLEKSLKSDTLSIELNDFNPDASYSSFIPEEEPSSCITNNELLTKADSKTKSSWRLPHLIKTLERYLNNKYKDDINALEKNREPQTMQEYLYQSLCNESKPLADKKLKELLNTFKENQHDRRIKFYCRLFQVYEPNPIGYKLSLYIIQMRNEFDKFVSKQVIPEALTKRVNKMQVLNLLGAARKLFGTDLETGKVVLKYLKPENMLSTVWTITCLEYFLYKNMVPAECFYQITKQETMTEQEFVTGLCKMDTFVSEDDLKELFNSQFTGFISIEEFTRLFDLDSFFKRNQIYMVDQLHFLNSLIEGYNSMRIRHYKEVENLIQTKCGKKLILTYEESNLILNELGTSADQVFPKQLEISTRDIKKKIFEMNIGGKGIGCYNIKAIKKISDTFEEKEL